MRRSSEALRAHAGRLVAAHPASPRPVERLALVRPSLLSANGRLAGLPLLFAGVLWLGDALVLSGWQGLDHPVRLGLLMAAVLWAMAVLLASSALVYRRSLRALRIGRRTTTTEWLGEERLVLADPEGGWVLIDLGRKARRPLGAAPGREVRGEVASGSGPASRVAPPSSSGGGGGPWDMLAPFERTRGRTLSYLARGSARRCGRNSNELWADDHLVGYLLWPKPRLFLFGRNSYPTAATSSGEWALRFRHGRRHEALAGDVSVAFIDQIDGVAELSGERRLRFGAGAERFSFAVSAAGRDIAVLRSLPRPDGGVIARVTLGPAASELAPEDLSVLVLLLCFAFAERPA